MFARTLTGVILLTLLAAPVHAGGPHGKSHAGAASPKSKSRSGARTDKNNKRDWFRFPKPARLKTIRHIVIDPGHGGDNHGAVGYWGTREKVLTLAIARYMRDYVQTNSDVKVSLTRGHDHAIGLRQRTRWANDRTADVFISLHCNSAERREANGMEVWYLSTDTSAEVIHDLVRREEGLPITPSEAPAPWSVDAIVAELTYTRAHERSAAFATALARGLRWGRPSAKLRGVKQAPFGVLKEARMPAVVLEVGFISNPKEGRELLKPKTHLQLSRGLLRGLILMDRQQVAKAPKWKRRARTMPAGPAQPRVGSPAGH